MMIQQNFSMDWPIVVASSSIFCSLLFDMVNFVCSTMAWLIREHKQFDPEK
jgi:hypothetical protein